MVPFTAAHQVMENSPPGVGGYLLLAGWLVVLGVALWAIRRPRG
jgi:hypothetical protein